MRIQAKWWVESTTLHSQGEDDDFCDDFPSAPPIDILDCIQGYEMVSFDAMYVPPPPHEPEIEDEEDGKSPDEEKCIEPGVFISSSQDIRMRKVSFVQLLMDGDGMLKRMPMYINAISMRKKYLQYVQLQLKLTIFQTEHMIIIFKHDLSEMIQ